MVNSTPAVVSASTALDDILRDGARDVPALVASHSSTPLFGYNEQGGPLRRSESNEGPIERNLTAGVDSLGGMLSSMAAGIATAGSLDMFTEMFYSGYGAMAAIGISVAAAVAAVPVSRFVLKRALGPLTALVKRSYVANAGDFVVDYLEANPVFDEESSQALISPKGSAGLKSDSVHLIWAQKALDEGDYKTAHEIAARLFSPRATDLLWAEVQSMLEDEDDDVLLEYHNLVDRADLIERALTHGWNQCDDPGALSNARTLYSNASRRGIVVSDKVKGLRNRGLSEINRRLEEGEDPDYNMAVLWASENYQATVIRSALLYGRRGDDGMSSKIIEQSGVNFGRWGMISDLNEAIASGFPNPTLSVLLEHARFGIQGHNPHGDGSYEIFEALTRSPFSMDIVALTAETAETQDPLIPLRDYCKINETGQKRIEEISRYMSPI